MPAKSVAQRKFMGMVRATQKGEMDNPSPELKRAANDMGAKAVNKFAKTKEKNLPQKIGEEKTKNCGCGKDPCITYGPKKNAHKMPDGTVMPGKEHKESYGVGGSLMFSGTPGGTSHSNTRVGSINKKDKKKKEVKEQIRAVVEAKYEAGASTYGKATIRNKRKFGKAGDMPDVMTGKKVNPTDETRGELILKRRADHKAKRGVKSEAVYTGPDKEDRKQIKKMDNPSYAKKLADYEKNMDPKKRQALKDKATKGMKFTREGKDLALDMIRKKYKDQIMKRGQPKKVRGAKSTVGTGKYKKMADQKKQTAADAKKRGFKDVQSYANTMARYGGKDNYDKGKGLGT